MSLNLGVIDQQVSKGTVSPHYGAPGGVEMENTVARVFGAIYYWHLVGIDWGSGDRYFKCPAMSRIIPPTKNFPV